MNNTSTTKQKLMPSAEIVTMKMNLVNRIHELEKASTPHISVLNELFSQNYDLNEKYDFFDQIFEENGKKGIKDITGAIRVPALYSDFAETYHYDVFRNRPVPAANDQDKFALVTTDGTGRPVTPFIYDCIHQIDWTNFYLAKKDGKHAVLTNSGEEVVPCIIDSISEACNGISSFTSDGKEGLFTDTRLYVAPIFDEITENDEKVYARLGNQWGYIDEEGNFIEEHDEDALDDADLLWWISW